MNVAEAIAFYSRQDEWASIYQGDVRDHHRDNAALIRELAHKNAGRVLELGCGGGHNAAAAAEAGFTVVALDIVPSVLENARRLAAGFADERFVVLDGDFYTIDVPGAFDVVCCCRRLQFLTRHRSLLNRVFHMGKFKFFTSKNTKPILILRAVFIQPNQTLLRALLRNSASSSQ